MRYVPKKLLKMNKTEIGNVIERTGIQSKDLKDKASKAAIIYNVAFVVVLVVGSLVWLVGGTLLTAYALIGLAVFIKMYGLIKVVRYEVNIALNNQIVIQFTLAGLVKEAIDPDGKSETLGDVLWEDDEEETI